MHGVILVKFGFLLDLAHHDQNRRDSAEDGIAGALVGLPGIDKMADALLEELPINIDVRHLSKSAMLAILAMADLQESMGKW